MFEILLMEVLFMEKIRTGVVGFGKMGLLHGALANIRDDMELCAICEKTMFIRNAFKSVMKNVRFYSNYQKMLQKEELDAVIITTPTFCHAEEVEYAAQHGIAIFCEKPLAVNGDSAEKLARLVNEKGLPSLVGFANRFLPTIAKGKELVEQNAVGGIKSIRAEMYIGDVFKDNSGWRYKPEMSGGGALIDFGIHMIDLLIWYFGKIASVEARMSSIYSKYVEDEMSAVIDFENGLKADFTTSWSKTNYRKSSPIITVKGESGELIVTDQTIDIKCGDITQQITYPDLYKGDYVDIAGINFTLEMKAFLDEIRGIKSGIDIEQGAYVQRVVDAMYRSAKSKQREAVV